MSKFSTYEERLSIASGLKEIYLLVRLEKCLEKIERPLPRRLENILMIKKAVLLVGAIMPANTEHPVKN